MQASIEQLKERLVNCLDEERNVIDMSGALDVLICLENSAVTKETLEATRLGLVVNDIRKKCAQTHSEISKKCRNLIKEWQKLLSSSSTEVGASGSATSSPAGGALTTPRGTAAAKLASVGLMCSPSPSLVAGANNRGKLTPKLPHLVNGNVAARTNGNSPKLLLSSDRTNAPQIQSNSYAPPSTSAVSGKGPSPLVLYSSSSSSVMGENNNNGYNKPSSPATTTTNSPASSSSTSLKIRIKVGGGSESASIVKQVVVDQPTPDEIVVDLKSNEVVVAKDLSDSHITTIGKKLTNGLNNVIFEDSAVPSTSSAGVGSATTTTSVVVHPKKLRQKRQLDQNSDSTADPLSMISKGGPLPKCKTTAALVAEMASAYPAEMAKSITNATLEISPDLDEDIVVDRTFDSNSNLNKRYASASRRNSSDAYYAKHDDYLDITKSEMVAHYLKTSIGEDDDDPSPSTGANRAYSPTTSFAPSTSVSGVGGVDQPRKRGRPRKNVEQYHSSNIVAAAGSISFKIDKRIATAVDVAAVDRIQTPTVKIKRHVNWYDILPPLNDNDKNLYDQSSNAGGDVKKDEQFLDSFWPNDQSTATASSSSTTPLDSGGGSFPDLHSRILSSVRDRRVLAMPYVDIGLPDFFEYRYPDSDRFIAHWSEL